MEFYDKIVAQAIEKLLTLHKNNERIILTNFDYKDEAQLFVLEIAKICGLWGKEVAIDSKCINPITFKIKSNVFEWVERTKDFEPNECLDTKKFLSDLMIENKLLGTQIFCDIYNAYYPPIPKKVIKKILKEEKRNSKKEKKDEI